MDVILMEKVGKLGDIGDQVSVKAGFGRNYLIPQGKAIFATPQNIAEFEQRRAELEKAAAERRADAESRAARIEELGSIQIEAKAGEGGKLFGSVATRDIAEALSAAGVEVSKSEVRLPEGPIRETGEYEVNIQVHADIIQPLQLVIVAR